MILISELYQTFPFHCCILHQIPVVLRGISVPTFNYGGAKFRTIHVNANDNDR